jgi:ssDNA-binding Zn-finger/Zn-ribbon topoisomerase 1
MKPENVKCPKCNGPMSSRKSKFGVFWGYNDYPNCKGTRDSMGLSKQDKEDNHPDRDYDAIDDFHPGNPRFYGDN